MKIYVAHSKLFDFKKDLYEPLRESELNKLHAIVLPHETDEFINSKSIIKTCDVVIAEVSFPSIGEGIELGWANDTGVPIICIYKQGNTKSGSLSVVSNTFIEYTNSEDLINELSNTLRNMND